MSVKLIALMAGAAGFGALVAWGVTADLADQKTKQLKEDFVDLQDAFRLNMRENIDLRYDLNDAKEELEVLHHAIDVETGFADPDPENSPGGDSSESEPEEEFSITFVTEESEDAGSSDILHSDTSGDAEVEPTDEEFEEERQKLQRLIQDYIPEPESSPEEPVVKASIKYDRPFVISQEEFAYPEDEGEDYAKITLRYFKNAQILLDEDDEPIDDVEAYVGWRALNRFGDESGSPDLVYVRNRRLEVDFEVEEVTDEELPLHVKYAMPKMEFVSRKNAGKIFISEEDG